MKIYSNFVYRLFEVSQEFLRAKDVIGTVENRD